MTLDEAISEFKERAEDSKKISELGMKSYIPKAKEEEQLAEWLEELKDYRDKNKMIVRIDVENLEIVKDRAIELAKEQYNKAIDDFAVLAEKWCWKHEQYNQDDLNELMEIAEQLKVGDGE